MKDLTGQGFERLVAIRPTKQRKQGFVVWGCICDCGCTTFASTNDLKIGKRNPVDASEKECAAVMP